MAEAVTAVTELEGWIPRHTGHSLQDGTPVTAWLRITSEGTVASDRAGTLSWMGHLRPGLRLAVRALCRTNDVQIDRGELCLHVPPGGDIDEAIDRLGRVCARVAKIAF